MFQLWTMYLEELSKNNASNSEGHNVTINILIEFWGKITPCILQLVSYSKAVSSKSLENGKEIVMNLLNYVLNSCKLIHLSPKKYKKDILYVSSYPRCLTYIS
jgi:hypothetical protein